MQIRFDSVVVLLVTSLTMLIGGCDGGASIEVRQKRVVGDQLRLIVETSHSHEPFWAHMSTVSDTKGYLVVVNLASSAPMEKRSRVYGPLWNVAQPRSEISFDASMYLTQGDVDAGIATPRCAFDENGELMRYRNDRAYDRVLVDRLDLASARWTHPLAYRPINSRMSRGSEDYTVSPSERYLLQYQDNQARLFDLDTGKEKEDAWLTARFAESRRIPHFQNIDTFITDDLNHLVVNPHPAWNEGGGGPKHLTFNFDGKTYTRADYFLCADRPEPALGLVQRKSDEPEPLHEAPDAAFTIDGGLMLMRVTKDAVRLYRRDGAVVYHTEAKVPDGWSGYAFGLQHLPAEGKLVSFNIDTEDYEQLLSHVIVMNTWDYRHGTVESRRVPIIDLFRESWGHYEVKHPATAVD